MYRVMGSIGNVGAARVTILAAHHPDADKAEAGLRVLAQIKANLSKLAEPIGYRLVSAPEPLDCAAIEWSSETIGLSADDLLRTPVSEDDADDRREIDKVLASLFDETTFITSIAGMKQMRDAGHTNKNAIGAARKRLGITAEKVGDMKDGYWVWRWPADPFAEPAPSPTLTCERCETPTDRRITHFGTGAQWCSDCCVAVIPVSPISTPGRASSHSSWTNDSQRADLALVQHHGAAFPFV